MKSRGKEPHYCSGCKQTTLHIRTEHENVSNGKLVCQQCGRVKTARRLRSDSSEPPPWEQPL